MGDFSVSSAAWANEEAMHEGGDGGVFLCGPDAGLAVGIVADGYGDVAHVPPGLGGDFGWLFPLCAERA